MRRRSTLLPSRPVHQVSFLGLRGRLLPQWRRPALLRFQLPPRRDASRRRLLREDYLFYAYLALTLLRVAAFLQYPCRGIPVAFVYGKNEQLVFGVSLLRSDHTGNCP